MVECPHTCEPPNHEVNDAERGDEIPNVCEICTGALQVCDEPVCHALNRFSAIYCTACGSEIEKQTPKPSNLAKGLRDRVAEAEKYQLHKSLRGTQSDAPILWLAGEDGAFVFTTNPDDRDKKTNLFYLSEYNLEPGSGRLLNSTSPLPGFPHWLQTPLVSQQGLFLVTSKQLHFFPSHGYERPYLHKIWEPNEQESIVNMMLTSTGHPLLLIKDSKNQLFVLEGNAQSGVWGTDESLRLALDYELDSRAALLFTTPNPASQFWIYDGVKILQICLKERTVNSVFESEECLPLPESFEQRLNEQYFTPLLVAAGKNFCCVLPIKKPNSEVNLGVLASMESQTLNVMDHSSKPAWVVLNPWADGFQVGITGVVKSYINNREIWHIEIPDATSLAPVLTQNWVALQIEHKSAPHRRGSGGVSLVFDDAKQSGGKYMIEDNSLTIKIDDSTRILPGLPPLYKNDCLFVAYQGLGDEVIVRKIQVSTR